MKLIIYFILFLAPLKAVSQSTMLPDVHIPGEVILEKLRNYEFVPEKTIFQCLDSLSKSEQLSLIDNIIKFKYLDLTFRSKLSEKRLLLTVREGIPNGLGAELNTYTHVLFYEILTQRAKIFVDYGYVHKGFVYPNGNTDKAEYYFLKSKSFDFVYLLQHYGYSDFLELDMLDESASQGIVKCIHGNSWKLLHIDSILLYGNGTKAMYDSFLNELGLKRPIRNVNEDE